MRRGEHWQVKTNENEFTLLIVVAPPQSFEDFVDANDWLEENRLPEGERVLTPRTSSYCDWHRMGYSLAVFLGLLLAKSAIQLGYTFNCVCVNWWDIHWQLWYSNLPMCR